MPRPVRDRAAFWVTFAMMSVSFLAMTLARKTGGPPWGGLFLGAGALFAGLIVGTVARIPPGRGIPSMQLTLAAVFALAATPVLDHPEDWLRIVRQDGETIMRALAQSVALSMGGLLGTYLVAISALVLTFILGVWDRVPPALTWIWQALPVIFVCALVQAVLFEDGAGWTRCRIVIVLVLVYSYPPIAFTFDSLREMSLESRLQLQLWRANGWWRLKIAFPSLVVRLLSGLKVTAAWALAAEIVVEYYMRSNYSLAGTGKAWPLMAHQFIAYEKDAGGLFVLSLAVLVGGVVVWGTVRGGQWAIERAVLGPPYAEGGSE